MSESNDFISATKSANNFPVSPVLCVFTFSNTLSENCDIFVCAFAPYCNICVASCTSIFD